MRCQLQLQSILIAVAPLAALAQEPLNADSATQPSPGHFTLKHQFRFTQLDADDLERSRKGKTRDFEIRNTVSFGLRDDLSLSLRTPVLHRRENLSGPGGLDRETGVGDLTLLLKWRFLQMDTGPLDTTRASVLVGSTIRTGDGPFTNDAYNPIVGVALTSIDGRHGFNAGLKWTFTTGGERNAVYPGMSTADVLNYDAAYLYRLSPAEFSADSPGAWYALVELNGVYETNGDNEILISPGIMFEAPTWVLELGVQLPVWQDVGNRPETDWVLIAGLRFSI